MRPFYLHIPEIITPADYKAMVLQLAPGEDDAEQQARMAVEKQFSRELDRAFGEQLNTLLPDDATDDEIRQAPAQVTATSEPVREVLRRNLERGSSLGASVALGTMQTIGMGFDFTLAHAKSAKWASDYSYELVRGINTTTTARMQTAVTDWFNERTTLPDLVKELEPTFGKKRAQLIAQTETTRAAVEGSRQGYLQSGVVSEMEIKTANDERVCVICGPQDGVRIPLTGGDEPPFHPGCRCWTRPVIGTPTS